MIETRLKSTYGTFDCMFGIYLDGPVAVITLFESERKLQAGVFLNWSRTKTYLYLASFPHLRE